MWIVIDTWSAKVWLEADCWAAKPTVTSRQQTDRQIGGKQTEDKHLHSSPCRKTTPSILLLSDNDAGRCQIFISKPVSVIQYSRAVFRLHSPKPSNIFMDSHLQYFGVLFKNLARSHCKWSDPSINAPQTHFRSDHPDHNPRWSRPHQTISWQRRECKCVLRDHRLKWQSERQ